MKCSHLSIGSCSVIVVFGGSDVVGMVTMLCC